jgi:predicted secreted protein
MGKKAPGGVTEVVMKQKTHRGLAAGAAALALAALGVALLAGCGGGEPAAQSSPATIKVAPTAPAGTTVDARVGDTVIVSLDANATTGYEWQLTAGETFSIESSEYVPDPNPDNLAGKGGKQVVTLKVTKAGTSDLTGQYVRSWETPSPSPAADITVTVVSS